MYTIEKLKFTLDIFKSLMGNRASHAVSIYLPMHKSGKEQNEHLAQANLKTCIRDVHKFLRQYQMNEDDITNYTEQLKMLLAETEIWRKPSDGLAIFMDKKGMNYFPFPISFNMQTYVADHFYLKPLLPLYHNDGTYYLLELSQDYVKLYEGSKNGFKDMIIRDFAPDQLEKAVGFDFRPKMLQFRSGQDAHGSGVFHGHGEGKDDAKKEILNFLRAIDKGINKMIKDQSAPLVLACPESLFSLYKKVNSYKNLYNKYVSGDPEFKNKKEMHKLSWNLVKDYFKMGKISKLTQFNELYHTSKVSYKPSDIIPAAINGKIDTLFIAKDTDLFGVYNKETNKVRLDDSRDEHNISLINYAALQTFNQRGKVFELEPNEMPVKSEPITAIYRY